MEETSAHYPARRIGGGQQTIFIRHGTPHARGFTLLETIITIGVISLILIGILGVSALVNLQRSTRYRAIARNLLAEEGEALRAASFSDLENRSNTQFIEVAYPAGDWTVQAPGTPQSEPNVYQVGSATGAANPSRQVIPTGRIGDGAYETFIRVQASSDPAWKVGLYLRYHDALNHYLVRFSSTTIEFVKTVEGVPTTLGQTAIAFSPGTWYRMTVTVTGASFAVSIDGTERLTLTDPGSVFTQGNFVLAGFDGASAEFDDISFSGTASANWNFDGAENAVNEPAVGWRKTSPTDLPSGATAMTISDAQVSFTDLKRIVLSVSWAERGATRQLANTFYINELSVVP